MSRYSQLYIERGNRLPDSQRMRVRLGAFADNRLNFDDRAAIAKQITETLGVDVPHLAIYGPHLHKFLQIADLRDALDAITILGRTFGAGGKHPIARDWWRHVRAVFVEEHLQYRLDDTGIVHPFIDAEFEANRSATLEALSDARLGEARADFEAAFRHLRDGEGK